MGHHIILSPGNYEVPRPIWTISLQCTEHAGTEHHEHLVLAITSSWAPFLEWARRIYTEVCWDISCLLKSLLYILASVIYHFRRRTYSLEKLRWSACKYLYEPCIIAHFYMCEPCIIAHCMNLALSLIFIFFCTNSSFLPLKCTITCNLDHFSLISPSVAGDVLCVVLVSSLLDRHPSIDGAKTDLKARILYISAGVVAPMATYGCKHHDTSFPRVRLSNLLDYWKSCGQWRSDDQTAEFWRENDRGPIVAAQKCRLDSSRFNRARASCAGFASNPKRLYCGGWAEIGTLSTPRRGFQRFQWQGTDKGLVVVRWGSV